MGIPDLDINLWYTHSPTPIPIEASRASKNDIAAPGNIKLNILIVIKERPISATVANEL